MSLKRPLRPSFLATGIAEVYLDGRCVATLAVSLNVFHAEQANADARWQAMNHLANLQVPEEVRQAVVLETQITEYRAVDAKFVRAAEGTKPIAKRWPSDAERADLVRQRRAVPDDLAESTAWYLQPQAATALEAA